MKIEVDRERCVGAGMCVLAAPEVFEQDEEEGKVLLLDPEPADVAGVAGVVQLCPAAAITVGG